MKIACVSISRSDWNALGMVAMALREQGAEVDTHTLTGHEAPEMLEADGFTPLREPPRNPDMIVLCGDRYATAIAAVQAAHARTPVAHLAGGDITEGSTDDSYRHAITKLAHLHFPTHEAAAQRIRQMGEEPWRVMSHGSASIDRIKATPLMSRAAVLSELGLPLEPYLIVLNWQPDSAGASPEALRALSAAMGAASKAATCTVAVGPNDDPGGEVISTYLKRWANGQKRVTFVPTLPGSTYLSLLQHADLLIGNSSSAFYEAAALGCPAVDIGGRQKGRVRTGNIFRAEPTAESINDAFNKAWHTRAAGQSSYPTPFGNGSAAPAIAKAILSFDGQRDRLLRKKFVSVAA